MEFDKMHLLIFSKLDQKWLYHCDATNKTRILGIDGGGTTGIFAGASLIYLEDQIQAKSADPHSGIADFFDIVTGTGIGALFTAMLTADVGNGRPLYTARKVVEFVTANRWEMFKVKRVCVLRRRRRFSGKSIEKVPREALRREDGKALKTGLGGR